MDDNEQTISRIQYAYSTIGRKQYLNTQQQPQLKVEVETTVGVRRWKAGNSWRRVLGG